MYICHRAQQLHIKKSISPLNTTKSTRHLKSTNCADSSFSSCAATAFHELNKWGGFEQIELPAKLLDYFEWCNKKNINQVKRLSTTQKQNVVFEGLVELVCGVWSWFVVFLCLVEMVIFRGLVVTNSISRRIIKTASHTYRLDAFMCASRLLHTCRMNIWCVCCSVLQ